MVKSTATRSNCSENLLNGILSKARIHRVSSTLFSDSLLDIQNELRNRRKAFLSSYVPLTDIVCNNNGELDEKLFHALVHYLTKRTFILWNNSNIAAEKFCHQFYELAILALSDVNMADQCLDDIIRLATLLTHDPLDLFEIVLKQLLPRAQYPYLYSFLEDYDRDLYVASFEDAVQGAICVLLGVLKDPLSEQEAHSG